MNKKPGFFGKPSLLMKGYFYPKSHKARTKGYLLLTKFFDVFTLNAIELTSRSNLVAIA